MEWQEPASSMKHQRAGKETDRRNGELPLVRDNYVIGRQWQRKERQARASSSDPRAALKYNASCISSSGKGTEILVLNCFMWGLSVQLSAIGNQGSAVLASDGRGGQFHAI